MIEFRNPAPTVDAIIRLPGERVVLIQRAQEPLGWAFPGGFIDYGERAEDAARREAMEETGLAVTLDALLGVYSRPDRDPRLHTMSVVYVASASEHPIAGDDAAEAHAIAISELIDREFAFDHAEIARDFLRWIASGEAQRPQ